MVMRLTGDSTGREVALVQGGVLNGLPPSVLHPVIDAWYDANGLGVLVMRDLGDAVLTWKSIVGRDRPERCSPRWQTSTRRTGEPRGRTDCR